MEHDLRRLQLTQLEILKTVDAICKKHHIPYSLYAGSLLGAVRHQGFIPWDDDLDICMARPDYNRFLQIWQEETPSGYTLQNKDISPSFTQSFSKIRKDNTTFLQFPSEAGKYHTGIFLDIFPVDRVPTEPLHRLLFFWHSLSYLLFCREFVPPRGTFFQRTAAGFLLALTGKKSREKRRQALLRKITRYSSDITLPMAAIETTVSMKRLYPADTLSELTELPFEDAILPCVKNRELFLTIQYGNYLQLPPPEERTWKHHPVLIDFEHGIPYPSETE